MGKKKLKVCTQKQLEKIPNICKKGKIRRAKKAGTGLSNKDYERWKAIHKKEKELEEKDKQ